MFYWPDSLNDFCPTVAKIFDFSNSAKNRRSVLDKALTEEELLEFFHNEVKILRQLKNISHKHIVAFVGLKNTEDQRILLLERLDNTLWDVIVKQTGHSSWFLVAKIVKISLQVSV